MDDNREGSSSSPHEAIFLVLTYLPLFELLAMTQVCKSLRDALNNDILPWLNIIVELPLSCRLNDDKLVEIASKAEGRLQILSLVNCVKITDDGLLNIVAQNTCITKLHLPYCSRLSPSGILIAVKLLTNTNNKLSSLRIDGIHGFVKDDFVSLQNMMNQNKQQEKPLAKIYLHKYNKFSTLVREEPCRSIDVDLCPLCDEVKMVFDCPKDDCKGCRFCIQRCIECGICSIDEFESSVCMDTLCLSCWLRLPKCNYCNTPSCSQHISSQHIESQGFSCDSCHFQSIYDFTSY